MLKNASSSIQLQSLQNLTPSTPWPGTVASTGAVAFALDSTDAGELSSNDSGGPGLVR